MIYRSIILVSLIFFVGSHSKLSAQSSRGKQPAKQEQKAEEKGDLFSIFKKKEKPTESRTSDELKDAHRSAKADVRATKKERRAAQAREDAARARADAIKAQRRAARSEEKVGKAERKAEKARRKVGGH